MPPVADRWQLILESQTRGEADLRRVEEAWNRVYEQADKTEKRLQGMSGRSARASKDVGDSFAGMGQTIQNAFINPLGTAGNVITSFFQKIGGGSAVLGGAGAAITATGAGLVFLAKSAADAAEQEENNAIRLGVSIREYRTLSQAAKEAGLSQDALVGTMKGLAKALSDDSEEGKKGKRALQDIGITATDAFGRVRPIKDLLLDIAVGLDNVKNPSERADAAMKVFGRSGMEVLPLMKSELRQTVEEIDKLNASLGFDGVKAAKAFDSAMDVLGRNLGAYRRRAGEFIAEQLLNAFDPDWDRRKKLGSHELNTGTDLVQKRTKYGTVLQNQSMNWGVMDQFLNPQREQDRKAAEQTRFEAMLNSDIQQRLSLARKALGEAETSRNPDAYDKAKKQVAGLEAEIVKLNKAKERQQEIDRTLAELGTAASAKQMEYFQESAKFLERLSALGLSDQQWLSATTDFYKLLSAESSKEERKFQDAYNDSLAQGAKWLRTQSGSAQEWEAMLGRLEKRADTIAKAWIESGRAVSDSASNFEKAAAVRQSGAAIRFTALRTGSGDEGLLIYSSYQERVRLANELYQIEQRRIAALVATIPEETRLAQQRVLQAQAWGELMASIDEARLSREDEIASVQRRNLDQVREGAGRAFDAMTAAGKQGLFDLGQTYLKSVERQIFQNLTVELAGNLGSKLSLPGQRGADGKLNLFGRLLSGTPFAADPLKTATDLNTLATQQNTAALLQATTITASGSPGGLPGLGPLFSGSQGGGIFNLIGRGSTEQRWMKVGPNPALEFQLGDVPYMDFEPITATRDAARMQKMLGYAAAIAAGGYGVYSGIRQGGGSGAATAIASAAGTAAALDPEPISKAILTAVAMAAGLATSMFGDPKQKRAQQLEAEAKARLSEEPMGKTYATDLYGQGYDYNRAGGMRPIVIQVNALDTKSIIDRRAEIGEAVRQAIYDYAPLAPDLRAAILPQ